MQLKTCPNCKETKELTPNNFYINLRSWCKPCYRAYSNALVRKKEARRRRHINRYKKMKGCAHCGYNKHPVALDFHHVGGKDKGIAGMLTYKLSNIILEIRKCIILCANCHRIEHLTREKQHESN